MNKLKFPYLGNQGILTSGRIMLIAKDDCVLILGKESVGISSTKTVNIDAKESIILSTPNIQLGLNAKQQVIRGTEFVNYFKQFLEDLKSGVAKELKVATAGNIHTAMLAVYTAGVNMENAINRLYDSLDSTLSNKTHTD